MSENIRKLFRISVLPLFCVMIPVNAAVAEPEATQIAKADDKASDTVTIIGRGDGRVRIIENGEEYQGFFSDSIRYVAYTNPYYIPADQAKKAKADEKAKAEAAAEKPEHDDLDEMLATRPKPGSDSSDPPKPRED